MLRNIALISFFASASMWAHVGVGAKYATRDPHTCGSTKDPAKGPISAEKAKQYVTCGYDHEEKNADLLWLIDVQQIEVGKPRPFSIRADSSEADPSQPVYPIRGKIVNYQCHQLANGYARGKNCYFYNIPNATGSCFRTSFGDWKCELTGRGDQQQGPGPTH